MLCLKSRTYLSALTLSALHYPYSTLTYRRSALISTVHCQDSLRAPTGNEFAVWRFFFCVFFCCCRFPPGGKRPTGKFIFLWNIWIYINLRIQYYFTFVERVGLNCYSCVLHFWFRHFRYVDKMAAVEGGKCPSVHTQILDRFECATEVFPVHCVLAHSPFLRKVHSKSKYKYRSARFQTHH